ncbi:alpha/beta-hydrolase [Aspergillus sclerotioniger CBS 115572]|uniref:Alpha/beta-hydrolase n=1 Tax=Aspergillus sclerotioniger CBS 115572 TaxID=1450535 RepID=A0A317XBU8_9EURO|nr:alpha/beta-hydrolase [Aspergillus sclerotioniger CBS 115572]PWY95989.1 alpha/beta-hydrolase [Aspergillus sclerotioniger CBS 115572]
MTSPTIIFSHGAWISPQFFEAIRSRLENLGFPTECPAHPSIGAEPPSKILADDVASFRQALTTLADKGKDLVVVAHSYGGVVVSNAVNGLDKASRTRDSKPGGIIQIVYMGSFALDQGQSLLGALGGSYPPWWRIESDYLYPDNAGNIGFQDLPVEEQNQWRALERHICRAVFEGEVTNEPWTEGIPCAYIVCEQDLAIPPSLQEVFAAKIAGPENTYRLPTSHSPFLSAPDRVRDVLVKIIKGTLASV